MLHNIATIKNAFLDMTMSSEHCINVFTAETVRRFAEVCTKESRSI
jgi:hypothetical protein